jgi:hypothetical protein
MLQEANNAATAEGCFHHAEYISEPELLEAKVLLMGPRSFKTVFKT